MPTNQPARRGKKEILILSCICVLVGAGLVAIYTTSQPGVTQPYSGVIDSYEKCAAAGNPILESYPEQCATKDGRHFTRKLSPEEQKRFDESIPKN